MQTLDLTPFGGEQPGDAYYFSPLKVNGFGMVDYSIKELDAYIYTESEGKKEGTCCLIYIKFFKTEGCF